LTREDAIQAAQQIDMSPGEIIIVQSDGQITHPHYHSGQSEGETHTDGWAIKLDYDGTYLAAKAHSDDVDDLDFT
jgi:hypothetical protein